MPLRVTQSMISSQLMQNLNRNLIKSDVLSEQMTTGKKINKPSDDPVGITYAMRYRSELAANEQNQKNVDGAASWLDYNDTLLSQAEVVYQRLNELTVKAATGTNPKEALDAIKSEVQELRSQFIDIGNSKINGKFVFNGQMTDKAPYSSATAADAVTDAQLVEYELGAGVKLPVNMSGNAIFGEAGSTTNVFKICDDFIAALDTNNTAGLSSMVDRVDSSLDVLLSAHSEIGARTNRLELMENRHTDTEVNLNSLQAKTEDADYDKLIIQSKINENIYQASLSVGAKIISPTLVDFLR